MIVDLFLAAGVLLMAVGAGFIFLPAGMIVAGALLIAFSLLAVRPAKVPDDR